MAIYKENNYGKISVSDMLYAEILKDCFHKEDYIGKIWPSSSKGRQIGNDNKINKHELASNIIIDSDDNGDNISAEIFVIIKFGISIKQITTDFADSFAEGIASFHGRKPEQIKVYITGVKSKAIAKRNLEVIREYES